jgi:hypothetical protein
LAALLVRDGDVESATVEFECALVLDPDCQPAKLNLSLLRAERPTSPQCHTGAERFKEPSTYAEIDASVRVAILSFLFNWPSTGGGTVHTLELARVLAEAGYNVRHIYARFEPWGIGRVEGTLPYPSEALDFDESTWNAPQIQGAFRKAVEAFDPDHVIITDSWNSKPLLAEAVRGYSYILRFQAMECLCPLNNVRLLPDGQGGLRQCTKHQLANQSECVTCLRVHGPHSGILHRAERALCAVGSTEYQELLVRAYQEATAVLVVNPLMEAMVSPYTERARTVTAGMDPARFPWPLSCQPKSLPEELEKRPE